MKRFYLCIISALMFIGAQAVEMQYFDFLKVLHDDASQYVFKEPVYVFPNGDTLLYADDNLHKMIRYYKGYNNTYMNYVRVVYKDIGIYEGLLLGLSLADLVRLNYVPEDAWAWGTFYDFKTQQSIPCVFGLIEDKTNFSKLQSGNYFRPTDGDIDYFKRRYYWYPFQNGTEGEEEEVIYKLDTKAKTITVTEKWSLGYFVAPWHYAGKKKNRNGTYSNVSSSVRGNFTMTATQTNTRVSQFVADANAWKSKIISNSYSEIAFTPFILESAEQRCQYADRQIEFNLAMINEVMAQYQSDINSNTCLENEIANGKADARKEFAKRRNITTETKLFNKMELYAYQSLLIMRDMNADKWTPAAYRFLLSKDIREDELTQSGYSQSETSMNGYGYVDLGLPSGTLWASSKQEMMWKPFVSRIYETLYGKDRESIINKVYKQTYPEDDMYCWGEINFYSIEGSRMCMYLSDDDLLRYKFDAVPLKYDYIANQMGAPWRCPSKKDWEELLNNSIMIDCPDERGRVVVVGPNGNVIVLRKDFYWTNDVKLSVNFERNWRFYQEEAIRHHWLKPVIKKNLPEEEVSRRKASLQNKPDPYEAYRKYKAQKQAKDSKVQAVVRKCQLMKDSVLLSEELERFRTISIPLFYMLHKEAGNHAGAFKGDENDMKKFLEPICYDYKDRTYTSERYKEANSFLSQLAKMQEESVALRIVTENSAVVMDIELSLPDKNPKKPTQHYKTSTNVLTGFALRKKGLKETDAGKLCIMDLINNLEEVNNSRTTMLQEEVTEVSFPSENDYTALVAWLEEQKANGVDYYVAANKNYNKMCRQLSDILGWKVDQKKLQKAQQR